MKQFQQFGAALGVALFFCLNGCAPAVRYPAAYADADLSLPFIPQTEFQCGPSAVAMVLAYSGTSVPLAQLEAEIYSPALHGSLQPALVAAGRRHGFLAYELDSFDEILAETAAGSPVIILQNRGLSWKPLWHYAVVTGFNAARRQLYLSSGTENHREIATRTVQATWARGGSWGLLLLPPGRLPQHSTPEGLIPALIGLDRVAPEAAGVDYAAALSRWPNHAGLATAYGNHLRVRGESTLAEQAYQAALASDPQHVPALNNLADLLLARGELEAARRYAEQAVAVDGPYRAAAQATLDEIERAAALKFSPSP